MEKVRGLQNLAFQLGLDEGMSLGCIIYTKCPDFTDKSGNSRVCCRRHLIYEWKEKS